MFASVRRQRAAPEQRGPDADGARWKGTPVESALGVLRLDVDEHSAAVAGRPLVNLVQCSDLDVVGQPGPPIRNSALVTEMVDMQPKMVTQANLVALPIDGVVRVDVELPDLESAERRSTHTGQRSQIARGATFGADRRRRRPGTAARRSISGEPVGGNGAAAIGAQHADYVRAPRRHGRFPRRTLRHLSTIDRRPLMYGVHGKCRSRTLSVMPVGVFSTAISGVLGADEGPRVGEFASCCCQREWQGG
jgi:hypothetical protein